MSEKAEVTKVSRIRSTVECDDGIVRWSDDPKAEGQAAKREAERAAQYEADVAVGFVVPGAVAGISSNDFTTP